MSDVLAKAADPATPLHELADLAHLHPEARALVAANPSTYDALLEWLGTLGQPDVDAALARRNGTVVDVPAPAPVATVPVAAPAAVSTWVEPTKSVPLRWGTYQLRYAISLGAFGLATVLPWILLDNSNFFTAALMLLAIFPIAIAIHPTTGSARYAAGAWSLLYVGLAFLVSLQGFLLLVLLALGVPALIASWFSLRLRPGRSYAALPMGLLSVLAAFLPFPFVLAVVTPATIVGAVWLGRLIATKHRAITPEQHQANREAQQHAARVEALKQWEAAYRDAHDGAAPPAGFAPPIALGAGTSGGTNIMAVLALVFGLGGGLLGIVFGHVAHSQIRRTGEQGWGLATAGLVLGYLGLAGWVVAIVLYAVFVIF